MICSIVRARSRVAVWRLTAAPQAGIDEKIGVQVPLDTTFRDEKRQADHAPRVHRRQADDPGADVLPLPDELQPVAAEPGRRSGEMPSRLLRRRAVQRRLRELRPEGTRRPGGGEEEGHLGEYGRPGAENGWRFLTGTKESVAEADASPIGFRFEFDKAYKEYNHPNGIIILSPEGKTTRYFYGIDYAARSKCRREDQAG